MTAANPLGCWPVIEVPGEMVVGPLAGFEYVPYPAMTAHVIHAPLPNNWNTPDGGFH